MFPRLCPLGLSCGRREGARVAWAGGRCPATTADGSEYPSSDAPSGVLQTCLPSGCRPRATCPCRGRAAARPVSSPGRCWWGRRGVASGGRPSVRPARVEVVGRRVDDECGCRRGCAPHTVERCRPTEDARGGGRRRPSRPRWRSPASSVLAPSRTHRDSEQPAAGEHDRAGLLLWWEPRRPDCRAVAAVKRVDRRGAGGVDPTGRRGDPAIRAGAIRVQLSLPTRSP